MQGSVSLRDHVLVTVVITAVTSEFGPLMLVTWLKLVMGRDVISWQPDLSSSPNDIVTTSQDARRTAPRVALHPTTIPPFETSRGRLLRPRARCGHPHRRGARLDRQDDAKAPQLDAEQNGLRPGAPASENLRTVGCRGRSAGGSSRTSGRPEARGGDSCSCS